MNRILLLVLCFAYCSLFAQHRQHQPVLLDFQVIETAEHAAVNPFTDFRLEVTFRLDEVSYTVPGFYAADGNAAETSASSGNIWRCIFTPDAPGNWTYEVAFRKGNNIAISRDPFAGESVSPHDGKIGSLDVAPVLLSSSTFEKHGRLINPGTGYLHYQDGTPLLKFGANSPENFLAYAEFDGTYSYDSTKKFLKTWYPHIQDWNEEDPTWQVSKGKGIIGALNYLASQGMNAVYALTLNIEGDARDVWPFTSHERTHFLRYDVSKLAQWDIVFKHAEKLGIIMHLITQEKENELILDDGYTWDQRKLYYRELVARFGYHKNIIWNMGEENGAAPFWRQGQNDQQRFAMIRYLKEIDPYKHPLVIHTLPNQEERKHIIEPLLGFDKLDGISMQISDVFQIHNDFRYWAEASEQANRKWILMMDEIGPWHTGTRTDQDDPAHDTLRHEALWGTLMAGGAGVEWYFGWHKPPNDLNAEDWRSRENIWRQSAIARNLMEQVPYTEMKTCVNFSENEGVLCLSRESEIYLIYLKPGAEPDFTLPTDNYSVQWANPLTGELTGTQNLKRGTVGTAPNKENQDWVIIVRKEVEK